MWAEEWKHPPGPLRLQLGHLSLCPTAFLDSIGMTRSATTADSVSTKFGRIPLGESPSESLGSVRHSRLMLTGDMSWSRVKFTTYLESDFMNFTAGQSPYRWRQYWGQVQIGKWEILGGQAWSLLRPNRTGVASDKDLMNTDVTDPAYHNGLIGSRVRQVRLVRDLGIYRAALAWEADGNVVAKLARDRDRLHLEAAAFTGRYGRRGASAAGIVGLTGRVRLVSQQFWAKRAAYQALGVVPAGPNGMAVLEGVETQIRKSLELYSYGGLLYAQRSPSNRVVRQWTVGLNHTIAAPSLFGRFLLSLQYSHLDRAIWDGRQGQMDFLMYRLRYTFN